MESVPSYGRFAVRQFRQFAPGATSASLPIATRARQLMASSKSMVMTEPASMFKGQEAQGEPLRPVRQRAKTGASLAQCVLPRCERAAVETVRPGLRIGPSASKLTPVQVPFQQRGFAVIASFCMLALIFIGMDRRICAMPLPQCVSSSEGLSVEPALGITTA